MISILQLYQPISTIQSIYQVNNGPNSAPPSVGSSNPFGTSSGSDRNSPLPVTNNQPIRTRMTKQHYHVLQRCLTCIWRLCMDLSTPSTQFNSVENQAEWEIVQKLRIIILFYIFFFMKTER
ncbi:predicted protein [Naegleria gruberi]|uniref:Predicted protein n=1 Tax=Naegleria gruberi TaxID=5762 RepID=D2W5T1_NAEGR|nr:uncharacterized protein NAEGRDRAFT_76774 [Naegleria gruberi]EFC35571.1 predicted protein [Naegleria gruberi]|eukprot:XP_002668315.1 predicted protein [Naegleria gruberi strain NEG-M]